MKSFIAAIFLVLTLAACQTNTPVTLPSPPTIASFSATPVSIELGSTSVLTWEVLGAETVTVNQGVGDVSSLQSVSVAPQTTTTYTLTANNADGSEVAYTTVTVTSPPQPEYYGYWQGYVIFVSGSQSVTAGAIGADYDDGVWAMCIIYSDCIAGYTDGWDLVDAVGARIVGTKTSSYVYVRYNFSSHEYFYSYMYPATRTSELSTSSVGGTLRELFK